MAGGDFALDLDELRAVAGFAVACTLVVLDRFELHSPGDTRPRDAVEAAAAFARGGKRIKAIRDAAWAAMRAASDTDDPVAREVARSALSASSAAYLHPLAKATQVKHILGAAAHAALALELEAADAQAGDKAIRAFAATASPVVKTVLSRYPAAPAGGGRAGELQRQLDGLLRPQV